MSGTGVAVRAWARLAPAGPGSDGWFDPAQQLGPRGWRYLTPATRYLLAAARTVEPRLHALDRAPDRIGVSIGTHASLTALREEFSTALAAEGQAGLSPAMVPNLSINIPASQLAIRCTARAFCLTFTDPVVAGLHAVTAAAEALERGQADAVLAGVTEAEVPGHPTLPGAALLLLTAGGSAGDVRIGPAHSGFLPRSRSGAPSPAAVDAAVHRIAELAASASPRPSDGPSGSPSGPPTRWSVLPVVLLGPPELADAVGEGLHRALRERQLRPRLSRPRTAWGQSALPPVLALAELAARGGGLVVALSAQGDLAAVPVCSNPQPDPPSHGAPRSEPRPTPREGTAPMPLDTAAIDPAAIDPAAIDLEELRRLVAQVLDVDPARVTDQADFVGDLQVDSLLALELAVTLERRYQVRLEEQEIIRLRTLGQVQAILRGKVTG